MASKPRVGVVFPDSRKGGVFQYAFGVADSLLRYERDSFDFAIVHEGPSPPSLKTDAADGAPNIAVPAISASKAGKALHAVSLMLGLSQGRLDVMDAALECSGIHIDILIMPTPLFFTVPYKTPYVVSLPDFNDKYFPDFPEYSWRTKLARDVVFRHYGANARMVVADSETTVVDLKRFAGVPPEKTSVIPYIPPAYIYDYKNMPLDEAAEIARRFDLPKDFLVYPAQFWYQKNHFRLVRALRRIRDVHGDEVRLVLAGNCAGSPIYDAVAAELRRLLKELDIERQVHIVGYVDEKEAVALYRLSRGLVSPALQVPTTIPPLEAMLLGVPVATVDLPEIPKQVDGAGLFFDPLDIEDMAEKIWMIWSDAELRRELVERGLARAGKLSRSDYAAQWAEVLKKALDE